MSGWKKETTLKELDGRVVFETPVLLPDEQFIAIDLIRGRTSRGRTRWKG